MKRLMITLMLAVVAMQPSKAQQLDSSKVKAMDALLDQYVSALHKESVQIKNEECDFMISACTDSAMKQYTALRLYDHFLHSKLMGDEAVAIHIFDEWFADGKVDMGSEITLMNAAIYADFNRQTLLGGTAPQMEMTLMSGEKAMMPEGDKYSVLYFYDTACSTCRIESVLLADFLSKGIYNVRFDAVYIGDDEDAWKLYVAEKFSFVTPKVEVRHLWDPSQETDFLRAYGLLQTPRMFLVAPGGRIVGRSLNTEALMQLLPVYLN